LLQKWSTGAIVPRGEELNFLCCAKGYAGTLPRTANGGLRPFTLAKLGKLRVISKPTNRSRDASEIQRLKVRASKRRSSVAVRWQGIRIA